MSNAPCWCCDSHAKYCFTCPESTTLDYTFVPWSKVAILGMVIQPLIGNPYNWYIKSYYWVDDHSLLYGNIGSLDPIAHLQTTNLYPIPSIRAWTITQGLPLIGEIPFETHRPKEST